MQRYPLLLALCLAISLPSTPSHAALTLNTLTGSLPIDIAHRGSAGTHPEESRAAYEHAVQLDTDFLECDLQASKDGVLICSHEPNLSFLITDIEEDKHRTLFPLSDRHEEVIDEATGAEPTLRSGWFIADYTWEAIKTLRLVQRYIERDNQYDNTFPLITLDELIEMAIKSGKGIYIESKDSTWLQNTRNINLPELMVKNLCAKGFCQVTETKDLNFIASDQDNRTSSKATFSVQPPEDGQLPCPIYLQTFCYDDLVYWNEVGATQFIPTVALVYDGGLATSQFGDMQHRIPTSSKADPPNVKLDVLPVNVADLKRMNVSYLGPNKNMILNRPDYIKEAHAELFGVHAWTFRNEVGAVMLQNKEGTFKRTDVEKNIDPKFDGDVYKEMKYFFDLGLDGFFSDYPGTVRNFLDIEEALADDPTNAPSNSLSSTIGLIIPALIMVISNVLIL